MRDLYSKIVKLLCILVLLCHLSDTVNRICPSDLLNAPAPWWHAFVRCLSVIKMKPFASVLIVSSSRREAAWQRRLRKRELVSRRLRGFKCVAAFPLSLFSSALSDSCVVSSWCDDLLSNQFYSTAWMMALFLNPDTACFFARELVCCL